MGFWGEEDYCQFSQVFFSGILASLPEHGVTTVSGLEWMSFVLVLPVCFSWALFQLHTANMRVQSVHKSVIATFPRLFLLKSSWQTQHLILVTCLLSRKAVARKDTRYTLSSYSYPVITLSLVAILIAVCPVQTQIGLCVKFQNFFIFGNIEKFPLNIQYLLSFQFQAQVFWVDRLSPLSVLSAWPWEKYSY